MAAETPTREAHDVAAKLLADLEHFGAIERPANRSQGRELVWRFARETVQPLIDEREEAVSRQFELEEGWRARVARFLRRVASAVEES